MRRQATILAAAAMIFFILTTESQAGVSGKNYGATVPHSPNNIELCIEFSPTLNLFIFAIGDVVIDDQFETFTGTYWEFDLFGLLGVFGASTESAGVEVTINGTHVFSNSISGTGDAIGGIGPFEFSGSQGCDGAASGSLSD